MAKRSTTKAKRCGLSDCSRPLGRSGGHLMHYKALNQTFEVVVCDFHYNAMSGGRDAVSHTSYAIDLRALKEEVDANLYRTAPRRPPKKVTQATERKS